MTQRCGSVRHRRIPALGATVVLLAVLAGCGEPASEELRPAPLPPQRPSITDTAELPMPRSGNTYFAGGEGCADRPGRGEAICSIREAVQHLRPGDTLRIRAGTYRERVTIDVSGVEDNPILITGDGDGPVVIDGGCTAIPCSDRSVADLSEPLDGILIERAHDLTIRNISVVRTPSYGINISDAQRIAVGGVSVSSTALSGILASGGSSITLDSNRISNSNMGRIVDGEFEAPEEAISVVGVSGFVVKRNHVSDTPKEGIDAKAGARGGVIEKNVVERSCAVGIYVNEAHDIEVSENAIREIGWADLGAGVRPCTDLDFYGRYLEADASGVLIATGDLDELSQGSVSNISIRNNSVDRTTGSCIETWDQFADAPRGAGRFENVTIESNHLDHCGKAGIRLGVREGVNLVDNDVGQTRGPAVE